MKKLSFFLGLVFLFSCASDEDLDLEKVREANFHLSKGECSAALSKLNEATSLTNDPFYISTLSSAYACNSDFTEINFLSNDVDNLDSSSLYTSLATFSTSVETSTESTEYNALVTAMETIIDTTNGGTSIERLALFGSTSTTSLNIQLLLMILAHTGKWVQYFGNADSSGTKGAGTQSNDCILNYDDANALAVITANGTGSCTNVPVGHPDLDIPGGEDLTDVSRRLCHFAVNQNHLLDIVLNTTLSASDSLGELDDLAVDVQAEIIAALALAPGIGPIFDFYKYQDCIDWATSSSNYDLMQLYFAAFLETNFL